MYSSLLVSFLLSIQWDELVSGKHSVYTWHSIGFNFIFIVNISVAPSLIEIFVQIIFSFLTFKTHMSFENFMSLLSGAGFVHIEFTCLHTCVGGTLDGVVLDGGVHELIITGSWSFEIGWNFSIVFTESFITNESILRSWVSWMWLILVPDGGWLARQLSEVLGMVMLVMVSVTLNCSEKSNNS